MPDRPTATRRWPYPTGRAMRAPASASVSPGPASTPRGSPSRPLRRVPPQPVVGRKGRADPRHEQVVVERVVQVVEVDGGVVG